MQLHLIKDSGRFSHSLADWVTARIVDTLDRQDRFTLVLSGGNTPRALYEGLAQSPYREQIPWDRLHFFWGDERAVPFEDDRNNAKMAFDTLLSHVGVTAGQVHRIRTDMAPAAAAEAYEKILQGYFPDSSPQDRTFDLVLLGMGDDGHTLSLFPGTEVVHEQKAWVKAYYLQAQQMYRITLTTTPVNRAACVAFLATGAGKAGALREVLEGSPDPDRYPSQLIRPLKGELHWFVDPPAASLLRAATLQQSTES